VTGDTDLQGALTVGGPATFNGTATFKNGLTAGALSVTPEGALSVGGTNLATNGDVTVGNNLGVTGSATVGNDLSVGRDASVGRDLAVTRNASVGNDLSVGNDASVGRNLNVGGFSNLSGGAFVGNSLTVGSGAAVSMGGNVVHDVADPLAATDAANKRYVDREIGKLDDELSAGIAIATALENPDLTGSETFGVMFNYGNYAGSSALGFSAAGVLGRGVFEDGDRLSIAGGVGVSTDEGEVAGRIGVQWTR
jgi:hypothetical protein